MSKKKHRIAIWPAESEQGEEYEDINSIADARKASKAYEKRTCESTSLKVFTFNTPEELRAFILGYEAMEGWMGDACYITEVS